MIGNLRVSKFQFELKVGKRLTNFGLFLSAKQSPNAKRTAEDLLRKSNEILKLDEVNEEKRKLTIEEHAEHRRAKEEEIRRHNQGKLDEVDRFYEGKKIEAAKYYNELEAKWDV